MSQSGNFSKWLFKHFVSDTPELDFSQVIDFEDEVRDRQNRIVSFYCVVCVCSVYSPLFNWVASLNQAQIPQERRVNVLESVILDKPCEYVIAENQACVDNFDLSYLEEVSAKKCEVSYSIFNISQFFSLMHHIRVLLPLEFSL